MEIYIVIIAFVISASILIYIYLKRKKKKIKDKSPYIDALHLLLEGKKDFALEKLKRTVREDTENIMAYIKLGDIFREKGLPIRAAKIHRSLLVRGDLSESEIDTTLYHLILDYKTSNMIDKAIEMTERLFHRSKRNVEIQQLLLSLYEEKGDWDKAFFHRQFINKWLKKRDHDILAIYKVQSGLNLTKQGAEREGRIRFREAAKLDKNCSPAYLYWGDSYRREGRDQDAYNIWREFTLKNPEWAHLAFERLRDVLFDLGQYGDIEDIYQQIIQKKPKNPAVYFSLAELYNKQGKLDDAVEICQKVLETHPNSTQGRYLLVQLLQLKGNEAKALEEALHILDKEMKKKTSYLCSECGFENNEPLWYCPQCHRLNTFLGSNNK